MKGDAIQLAEFMESAKKRFIIPVYQRNYDWKKEQCAQLFDDLVKVVKQQKTSHFFGSIVSFIQSSVKYHEYLIIDGQQRLTTVSLLLLAMRNLLVKGIIKSEKEWLPNQIYNEYLVDKYQENEPCIKLKPVKKDNLAFSKLFRLDEEAIRGSNVTLNYDYFYARIQHQEITVDELMDAIGSLQVVHIALDHDDDPQLIFESLNSTGLDLREGDKIRNYVLMGLPASLQQKYYDQYWSVIEELTHDNVSSFIRDFLCVKQREITKENRVYLRFKEYSEKSGATTDEIFKELLAYAKRYHILLDGAVDNIELSASIDRLNRLETTVTRPFLLEVLRLYDEGSLTLKEVNEVFHITESYLFRRIVCDLPSNALNKLYAALFNEIRNYDKTVENFVEKYKRALLSLKESRKFPTDEEFVKAFKERDFYSMKNKNKIYLLERLENYDTKEVKNVYAAIENGDYSIEHIMPRTLTPEWEALLGDDYQAIHETWLNRVANLTLTAYNSKYSNHSFENKKNMKHGFKDSGLRLNAYVALQNKWTVTELEERNLLLVRRALEIWDRPTTTYAPPEKEIEFYSLADDYSLFTSRKVAKFRYMNMLQQVQNWKDFLEKAVRCFYDKDPLKLIALAHSKDEKGEAVFFHTQSKNEKGFPFNCKIAEECYVSSHSGTAAKLSLLGRLCKLYDVDPSEIQFSLYENASNEEEDE